VTAIALALAGVIWSVAYLGPRSSIKSLNVPVEFTKVPKGLDLTEQSGSTVNVRLRGNPWILESIDERKLVVRFSLEGAGEGRRVFAVTAANLNLPAGLQLERVDPETITVNCEVPRKPK
jgi:diadenylate cyclase